MIENITIILLLAKKKIQKSFTQRIIYRLIMSFFSSCDHWTTLFHSTIISRM